MSALLSLSLFDAANENTIFTPSTSHVGESLLRSSLLFFSKSPRPTNRLLYKAGISGFSAVRLGSFLSISTHCIGSVLYPLSIYSCTSSGDRTVAAPNFFHFSHSAALLFRSSCCTSYVSPVVQELSSFLFSSFPRGFCLQTIHAG